MGSLLLCGGSPGKRFCLPHSSIMIHQPSGGYFGQATDIAIHAREILRIRTQLNRIYARHLTPKEKKEGASLDGSKDEGDTDEGLQKNMKKNNTAAASNQEEGNKNKEMADEEKGAGVGSGHEKTATKNTKSSTMDDDDNNRDHSRSENNTTSDNNKNRRNRISVEEIDKLMERDYFMGAQEALDLGIVDEILERREAASRGLEKGGKEGDG